jgi:hypothetical protein
MPSVPEIRDAHAAILLVFARSIGERGPLRFDEAIDTNMAVDSFTAAEGIARNLAHRSSEFQMDKLRIAAESVRLLRGLHENNEATDEALERLRITWYSSLRLDETDVDALCDAARVLGIDESSVKRVAARLRGL